MPPDPFPRRHSATALALLAGGLSFSQSLLRRRPGEQATVTVVCTALGAGGGLAAEAAVQALGRRIGGEGPARAALVAAGLIAGGTGGQRHPNDGVALAATTAQVLGVATALGALTPPRPRHRLTRYDAVAVVAAATVLREVQRRRKVKRRAGKVFLEQYPVQRWLDTVSGGEGSLAPRDTLDFEGTRFIGGVVPAEDIVALLGDGDALDPIRVFVGVKTAPTPAERARIAVDELERLGAFDRARLLVCSPPLRGYVNPVPVKTHEVLSRGDVASVTVQYFDRPTPLMPMKVPVAALTHRLVLEDLHRRFQVRAAAGLPCPAVEVYGESLGAWASQDVFLHRGLESLDGLGVSRALWAGTPAFSRLRRWMVSGRLAVDDRVAFVRCRDLYELALEEVEALRFVFLYRRIDPVVLFSGLDLLWRRPGWLDAHGQDRWQELPRIRWIAGVTFVQLTGDLMRATRWTGGIPQAAAHDYRIEMPLAVNVAFGHHRAPVDIAPIAERIIARETGSLERLKALNRGLPDPGLPPFAGPRDPMGRPDIELRPDSGAAASTAATSEEAPTTASWWPFSWPRRSSESRWSFRR